MSGPLGAGEFIVGALLLGVTLGCAAGTAAVVVRRRLADLEGAPRAVAFAVVTIAATLAAELVPLMLGVLTRATVPITAALLLALAMRLRDASGGDPPRGRSSRERRFGWLLAGAALLATATAWVAFLQTAATQHVVSVDALGFHFPDVIRFIQTGTLWRTTQFLPGQAQGNYPQYGDLLLLAATLPWHSLSLVRYVDPLMLGLAGLGTYAIARELRAPGPTALLSALALISIRPTLNTALPDVLTDPTFLACFAAGTLFLLRYWRTARRAELALAGLAFGLAVGTKWYGLTDVPAVILAWLAASIVIRSRRTRLARDAALLIGVIALAGGIWMLRNLVMTGNPVFDYRVSVFGATVFSAPPDPLRSLLGSSIAHYLGNGSVLRHYIWPVIRAEFGLAGALIGAGAIVAGARGAISRLRGQRAIGEIDARILILLAAAVVALVAYVVTPYSAQGPPGMPVAVNANTRYGMPALLLAAPLLALAPGRSRFLRLLVEAALLGCVLWGLHRHVPTGAGRLLATGAVLTVLALLLAPRRARTARSPAVVAGAALAIALAYHYQRHLNPIVWQPEDPTVDYVLLHDPAHTRIAVAGTWTDQGLVPVAPLFGPRLQNTVEYVGPSVEHRLEQYSSERPFVAALRRGRYQLLEVGTGFPPARDPVAVNWAVAGGYTFVVRSARLILLRAPRG